MKYSIKIDDKRSSKDFRCGMCGICCGQRVIVGVEDVERLINRYPLESFLYSSEDEILLSYFQNCRGTMMLLKQTEKILTWTKSGYDSWTNSEYVETSSRTGNCCIFLNSNLCSVHEIKPDVCRIYPFRIKIENIEDNNILAKLSSRCSTDKDYDYYYEQCKGKDFKDADEEDRILDISRECIERSLRNVAAILYTQEEVGHKHLLGEFQRLSRNYHQINLDEAIKILSCLSPSFLKI